MNPFILGQITLFTFITIVSFFFVYKRAKAIYRNIKLGRKEIISDRKGIRFKNMLLIAFGQQKMFKNPLVAILHFTIYVAFIITQIELIEIFIDGYTGHHRIIYHAIESIYGLKLLYVIGVNAIEFLSVLAFIATLIFLSRRNLVIQEKTGLDLATVKELEEQSFKSGEHAQDNQGQHAKIRSDFQTTKATLDLYISAEDRKPGSEHAQFYDGLDEILKPIRKQQELPGNHFYVKQELVDEINEKPLKLKKPVSFFKGSKVKEKVRLQKEILDLAK